LSERDAKVGERKRQERLILMKRRLAAILVGDVVGYSAMMEANEEETAAQIANVIAMAREKVGLRGGRVFKTMGDAVLADFASPVNALRCAVEMRSALAENTEVGMQMRFGLHLADVIESGEDLIGDGVNLAARIQAGADPGAIEISGALFEQVRRNSPFTFEPLRPRRFKNMSEEIPVYRLRGEQERWVFQTAPTETAPRREKRPYSIAVVPLAVPERGEEMRFLADGLTEDLILELGRFRRLFVSSRTPVQCCETKIRIQSRSVKLWECGIFSSARFGKAARKSALTCPSQRLARAASSGMIGSNGRLKRCSIPWTRLWPTSPRRLLAG
jgi:class 3 adenylate cyclase